MDDNSPLRRAELRTHLTLHFIERIGLMFILFGTVLAIYQEIYHILVDNHGQIRLHDLLLMFIYLEVIAMVGVYFKEHRLPVRFPLYIAIVALARYLILDSKEMGEWGMIAVGATIILLTAAVLMLKFSRVKFPQDSRDSN